MGFSFEKPGAALLRPRGPAGRRTPARRGARGSVLVVAMWIMLVLVGLVLVLARTMRAEGDRAANEIAAAQATAIEDGAIQYAISCVDNLGGVPPSDDDTPCEALQLGDGLFWILRSIGGDDQTYFFGITDEAGKVNLNTATLDMLTKLPKMTSEFAASIIDWRDPDSTVTPGGAESEYYLMLPDPYECKNGPLETVEEAMLIRGATTDIVYGADLNRNGVLDPGESTSFISGSSTMSGSRLDRGIINLVTVYSADKATTGAGAVSGGTTTSTTTGAPVNINSASVTALNNLLSPVVSSGRLAGVLDKARRLRPFRNAFDFYFRVGLTFEEFQPISGRITTSTGTPRGLININSAPREVLLCLPTLDDSDVSALLAARPALTAANADRTSIAWVVKALPQAKASAIGSAVTGRSYQFSADIISVSGNGRAFKRCRVVLDARTSPPRVIYRQDLTHLGWPLDPNILTQLRSGIGPEQIAQNLGQRIVGQ
jgi:type II secretory pathway component PulK